MTDTTHESAEPVVVGSSSPKGGNETVKEIALALFKAKGWMKLSAILLIIGGIFSVPVGILNIIMGVVIWGAAGKIDLATATGDKDALMGAMNNLRTYFILYGILSLIGIIVFAVVLAIAGGAIITAIQTGSNPDFWDNLFGMTQVVLPLMG